jgi:rfaE bifunctional protein nucleotidyltransferase chain/domain
MASKILARAALSRVVRTLKAQGKTIVTTNGSFDLLHAGHVKMLEEAKSLGDVLIVGMNSDVSVIRYKGRIRPICPQEQRAAMLAALACTDYVTIFDELTPIPLLEIIQPDIHVNSPEHGYECVEREVVERHGGRIHLAQLIGGMSTTQLLARITEAMSQESRRGIFLASSVLSQASRSQASSEELLRFCSRIAVSGVHLFFLISSELQRVSGIMEACQQEGIVVNVLKSPLNNIEQIDTLVNEYDVTLAKSVLISRSMADIQIGREINCKTVFLADESGALQYHQSTYALGPNFTAHTLQDALQYC